MVSSIKDSLSASRTSSCHWPPPKIPTTQGWTLKCDSLQETKERRPHPLVMLGSLPLSLHQQNQATPDHVHWHTRWLEPMPELGWMENSPKQEWEHCCLKGLCHYVPCPLTACPQLVQLMTSKSLTASHATFTHHGWTWGAIKEVIEEPPTELENSHMIHLCRCAPWIMWLISTPLQLYIKHPTPM